MWTAYPCRWADRADYEAALAGVDMQGLDLLETGRVMTPPLVDAEGEILAAGDALPGWHVSVACRDRALPEGWPVIADPPLGMLRHDLAPPVPAVPWSVTNFQARAVMRATILADGRSLETAVRDYLADQRQAASVLPEAAPARIAADTAWLAWEQSNDFERNGALVTGLGPAFGLDDAAVDALFIAAAGVVA